MRFWATFGWYFGLELGGILGEMWARFLWGLCEILVRLGWGVGEISVRAV